MIQMVTDEENGENRDKEENKDKPYDEISDLLKRFYKSDKEISQNVFWEKVLKQIDSLFHKELLSEKYSDDLGNVLSDEARYWIGLEEYVKNEVSSLRHKLITDHLLNCNECRQNYNDLLDKKKPLNEIFTLLNLPSVVRNNFLDISFV